LKQFDLFHQLLDLFSSGQPVERMGLWQRRQGADQLPEGIALGPEIGDEPVLSLAQTWLVSID
jgi:hypothetical protein